MQLFNREIPSFGFIKKAAPAATVVEEVEQPITISPEMEQQIAQRKAEEQQKKDQEAKLKEEQRRAVVKQYFVDRIEELTTSLSTARPTETGSLRARIENCQALIDQINNGDLMGARVEIMNNMRVVHGLLEMLTEPQNSVLEITTSDIAPEKIQRLYAILLSGKKSLMAINGDQSLKSFEPELAEFYPNKTFRSH